MYVKWIYELLNYRIYTKNITFTKNQNIVINYAVYKNEISTEWVTFVHGAGGSSSVWFKQIREFQKHFNVLLLDLRGHGNSKSHLFATKQKYTCRPPGSSHRRPHLWIMAEVHTRIAI